jgi:6-phosphogluconolactonase
MQTGSSIVVAGVAMAAALASAWAPQEAGRLMLVGTYTGPSSRGIHAFRFDPSTGAIAPVGLAAETPNPSFLTSSADGRFVFAVNEVSSYEGTRAGSVTSFAVDAAAGRLTPLSVRSTQGADPCHLALDRTGRFLAVANYTGGNFVVLPVGADGRLGEVASDLRNQGSGPNRARQDGPHAHMVQFDEGNRFLLGADLGLDRIVVYPFDAATGVAPSVAPASFAVAPGAGARHFAFHPADPLLFVINELASTVESFGWDAATRSLDAIGHYSTLPDDYTGESTTAEIAVHPNGRFLYGSNRGHDSIAVFAISSDGQLAAVEHTSTRGRTPRHFAIDPSGRWLIAANQQSDSLAVFAIDESSGRLTPTGGLTPVGAPVSILFVP